MRDQHQAVQRLLQAKKLPLDFFTSEGETQLSITDDIAKHAYAIYNGIYKHPYSDAHANATFPRAYHGIAHVSRVAYYILGPPHQLKYI